MAIISKVFGFIKESFAKGFCFSVSKGFGFSVSFLIFKLSPLWFSPDPPERLDESDVRLKVGLNLDGLCEPDEPEEPEDSPEDEDPGKGGGAGTSIGGGAGGVGGPESGDSGMSGGTGKASPIATDIRINTKNKFK